MKTVLKAEMLAAMPAMKEASRPVIARPSSPLGRTSRMSSRTASLYLMSPTSASTPASVPSLRLWISPTSTAATMPGIMTRKGTNILAKVPTMGAERAEEMESAAMARWTSTKLVVQ